jgi:putative membrane protein
MKMSDKVLFRIIFGITLAVIGLVILLNLMPKPDTMPDILKHFPALNAILNGTCTILLFSSYLAIRNKNVKLHRILNITAFVLSAIFLLSYVAYHAFGKETYFPKDNPLRPVYLFILTSHIILAGLVLPLVLYTFYRGLSNDIVRHRKIARWTMPIWLYVTTTGVVVYLMISPYYPF